MPSIDVDDVIFDDDFLEDVALYSYVVAVGADGRTSRVETTSTIAANVQQGDGDILDRLGDAAKIRGSISIVTSASLSAGERIDEDTTRDADEIVWNGRRYVVSIVSDYSNYGSGFCEAVCTLKPLFG